MVVGYGGVMQWLLVVGVVLVLCVPMRRWKLRGVRGKASGRS